jgi:hypothetical protein
MLHRTKFLITFTLFISCVCGRFTLPKTVTKMTENGILRATFSDDVDLYEDKLITDRVSAKFQLQDSTTNIKTVPFQRGSGFEILVKISNIQLNPKFVPVNRTGENDNYYLLYREPTNNAAYRNSVANLISTYCPEPIPDYYKVSEQRKTLPSGLSVLNCSNPDIQNNPRYGCPDTKSDGSYYRYFHQNCCCDCVEDISGKFVLCQIY